MKRPLRPLPVLVHPGLTTEQCEAIRRLIGDEMKAPRYPDDHALYVQSLGAITESQMRVREGK